MKNNMLCLMVFMPFLMFSQTQSRNDAGLQGNAGAISGFFETAEPVNYPSGASSWWHLLDVRHSNNGNNYAMQFAGSFFDQNLYFRKTNNNPSQPWQKVILEENGKVGIGTNFPNSRLQVEGDISSSGSNQRIGFSTNETFTNVTGTIAHYGMSLFRNSANEPGVSFSGYYGLNFYTTGNERMRIVSNGNVGIGSINPDEKLTVKGKIHAEEVTIDLNVPADYVFEKYYTGSSTLKSDYVMPTLAEVEKFTREKNHLPNIPSAKEIKDKGLQVGEMSNAMLQKIEELTLYIIEQNKRIEILEAKVNKQ